MGCCTVMKHELFHASMFDLSESFSPSSASSTTIEDEAAAANRIIDMEETFAPRPHRIFIITKFMLAFWFLTTLVISVLAYEPYYGFYFAYLSSWGFVFIVAYAICSFCSAALFAYYRRRRAAVVENNRRGMMMMMTLTWALFAVALPAGLIIVILFWILVFNGRVVYTWVFFWCTCNVQYIFVLEKESEWYISRVFSQKHHTSLKFFRTLMLHGIAWVVIGVDGIIINRIPLRMKQFIIFELIAICYLIWSVLHSVLSVGNPWYDDSETIYNFVDWKNNTGLAVGLALGILFVANPIAFLLCRALSRCLPLRCSSDEASQTL